MARFSGAFFLVTIVATLTFIASTVIQPFFTLYVNEVVSSSFELGMGLVFSQLVSLRYLKTTSAVT